MDSQRARYLFGAVSMALGDEITRAAAALLPETGSATIALEMIGFEPGLSIRSLAEGVRLSHPGAVRLVDRLEADELVERRANPKDGRIRSLHLTTKGQTALVGVLTAREFVLSRRVAPLTKDQLSKLGEMSEQMLQANAREQKPR